MTFHKLAVAIVGVVALSSISGGRSAYARYPQGPVRPSNDFSRRPANAPFNYQLAPGYYPGRTPASLPPQLWPSRPNVQVYNHPSIQTGLVYRNQPPYNNHLFYPYGPGYLNVPLHNPYARGPIPAPPYYPSTVQPKKNNITVKDTVLRVINSDTTAQVIREIAQSLLRQKEDNDDSDENEKKKT